MANDDLEALWQELEWRRCRDDEIYFFQNYWTIKHPARGRIKFEVRDAQRYAVAVWAQERYSLTLKARQIGWSTLVAAHQFWLTFFYPDREVIDISRTEREAIDLLGKTKYGYYELPAWLKARGPSLLDDNQQRMTWSNNSSVTSMPSKSDPARGKSAYLIVVDEWAFLENQEGAWASIEPVADVGGRVIGLSTANGAGNWFHVEWVAAEVGTSNFKPMFAPWWANGDRDPAWYENKKKSMPSWQLAQEYPSNPEEAFLKSGNPVFDLDDVAAQKTADPYVGVLHELGPRNYEFQPVQLTGHDGPVSIWEYPIIDRAYVLGADVAEGLEHGDYSSAHIIEAQSGLVVATWHGHTPADLFGEDLYRLGLWYNTALVGVESNNHGHSTLAQLRRMGYPKLFRQRSENTVTQRVSMDWGWRTTQPSKAVLIDELGAALRAYRHGTDLSNSDIAALEIRDTFTLAELRTFVRDEKAKMHGSPHDDRVMSLAIANKMRQFAHAPEYMQVKDDTWTWDWWDRQGQEEPGEWVIGRDNARPRSRPGGQF